MIAEEITKAAFSGHETFPFRYAWLPKAVRSLSGDAEFFGAPEAMVTLGVGKNMVVSIRHWALATGIVEEVPHTRGRRLAVTPLGQQLFSARGWDPYLEDPATLWLLHWQLARNSQRATTWYWVFSHLPQPEFSKADLLRWLTLLVREHGWSRVPETTLRRDIDCFVRTYVAQRPTRLMPMEETLDCPLVELGLLREFGGRGQYVLLRGEQSTLPDALFAYALIEYLRSRNTTTQTVAIDSVAFSPASPGRVFCLTENAFVARLERLDRVTDGALVYDETAGLRQVLIRRTPDPLDLLAAHYASARTTGMMRATGAR